jgi:RNA polymerase sigma-70 factor (ECF subfamily)
MGQIVASLIAMTGDRDLAEECAQDAFTRALQARDREGAPAVPRTWLTTERVRRRRAQATLSMPITIGPHLRCLAVRLSADHPFWRLACAS